MGTLPPQCGQQNAGFGTPEINGEEHSGQREHLPDLHSNVEAENICDKTIAGKDKFLELGSETEAMEKPEHHDSSPSVRPKTQNAGSPVSRAVTSANAVSREFEPTTSTVW